MNFISKRCPSSKEIFSVSPVCLTKGAKSYALESGAEVVKVSKVSTLVEEETLLFHALAKPPGLAEVGPSIGVPIKSEIIRHNDIELLSYH